jgi:hypothetical protein
MRLSSIALCAIIGSALASPVSMKLVQSAPGSALPDTGSHHHLSHVQDKRGNSTRPDFPGRVLLSGPKAGPNETRDEPKITSSMRPHAKTVSKAKSNWYGGGEGSDEA